MDAFAVSIANGMTATSQKRKNALIMASFFSAFQMLMPLVGWLAGLAMRELIMGIDHWIAFSLLTFIGAKMIYESTNKENSKRDSSLRIHTLLTLAVATSIDALMVGLSFAFLQISVIEPILVIGLVTFSLSLMCFFLGCDIGGILKNKIKIVGGLILIAIGLRILLEHLV